MNTAPPTITGTAAGRQHADARRPARGPAPRRSPTRASGSAAPRRSGTVYAATGAADAPSAYWRLGETSGTTAADASRQRAARHLRRRRHARTRPARSPATPNRAGHARRERRQRRPQPDRRASRTTAISAELWVKTTNTTKEAGIVSYAATTSDRRVPAPRPARRCDVYVKGARVDTGVALNDGAVAPPRGDVDVDRRRGARLQGRRPRVLEHGPGADRRVAHRAVARSCSARTRTRIGGGFDTAQAFLGQLDEVALYPTALTAAQVAGAPGRRRPAAGPAPRAARTSPTRPGHDLLTAARRPGQDAPGARHRHERAAAPAPRAPPRSGPVTAARANTPPVPVIDTPATASRGRPATPSASPATRPTPQDGTEPGEPAVVGRSSSATAPRRVSRAPARDAARRRRAARSPRRTTRRRRTSSSRSPRPTRPVRPRASCAASTRRP